MITDDTILERLRWREFERSGESYRIAGEKYNAILKYIFEEYTDRDFYFEKDGIKIAKQSRGCDFTGVNLNFYNNFERKRCFRYVEFKGTAKDFKAKILEKFEALKSLKQEADTQTALCKDREIADGLEITRLTQIAKRAFEKYKVTISKSMGEYRLTLEIDFNDKRELLRFCDLEELV